MRIQGSIPMRSQREGESPRPILPASLFFPFLPQMFCNSPGYGKSYYFDFLCRTYYNAREFELQTEAKGMAESGVGVGWRVMNTGRCKNHPLVESSYYCAKYQYYLCPDCLKCSDPQFYCKFRTACIICFFEKEKKEKLSWDGRCTTRQTCRFDDLEIGLRFRQCNICREIAEMWRIAVVSIRMIWFSRKKNQKFIPELMEF